MVDRKIVTAKLAEMQDRASRARKHAKATAAELAADRDALDLVAFNLMLAVQACADIASHIIADEGWTPAGNGRSGCIRDGSRDVADERGLKPYSCE